MCNFITSIYQCQYKYKNNVSLLCVDILHICLSIHLPVLSASPIHGQGQAPGRGTMILNSSYSISKDTGMWYNFLISKNKKYGGSHR